jgi:hypothetical protein
MPRYKVVAIGFHGGHLYDPNGKRRVLHTDKPFKKGKLPSWLEEMKPESAAVRKKREAQEASTAAAAAEKSEQDQQEIADASFMGEGENAAPGSAVETL